MRALEVLGLAEDGAHLVCHDAATGEEFVLPANERLRAAARGDITRLGQLEIEMESQLRPKEIQARIRAGASVAEVAAAAGTSAAKIERFAYPVLMERSTMAELANTARPMGAVGPATRSIKEIVDDTLASRGNTGPVDWDSYKDADGWMLAVTWRVGRSENTAVFAVHRGPGGGTVVARDEAATDLLDPAPKPLRTVRPAQPSAPVAAAAGGTDIGETQRIPKVAEEPEILAQEPAAAPRSTKRVPAAIRPKAPEPAPVGSSQDEQLVAETVEDERAGASARRADHEQIARTGTDHVSPRSAKPAKSAKSARSGKPAMPSWDDVLLGTGLRQH
jgi:hypothetical protein